jgi:hypothetical protein
MATVATLNVAVTASTSAFARGMREAKATTAQFSSDIEAASTRQLKLKQTANIAQKALGDQSGTIGFLANALDGLGLGAGVAAASLYVLNKAGEQAKKIAESAAQGYEVLKNALTSMSGTESPFSGQTSKNLTAVTTEIKRLRDEAGALTNVWFGSAERFAQADALNATADSLEVVQARLRETREAVLPLEKAMAVFENDSFAAKTEFSKGSAAQVQAELQALLKMDEAMESTLDNLTEGTAAYNQVLRESRKIQLSIQDVQDGILKREQDIRNAKMASAFEGDEDSYDFKPTEEEQKIKDMFERLSDAGLTPAQRAFENIKQQFADLDQLMQTGSFDPNKLAGSAQGIFDQYQKSLATKDQTVRGTFQQIDTSLVNVEGLTRQKREVQQVESPQLEEIRELLRAYLAKASNPVATIG